MNLAAERFELRPAPSDWWDFWHYHADWPGWGNLRGRYRREHLEALATVFRKIITASHEFSSPFQSWILISGRDAGEDAVYLHTPNGNGTSFPFELGGVRWGNTSLLPMVEELLPGLPVRVGALRDFDELAEPPRIVSNFFVYGVGAGVPLER